MDISPHFSHQKRRSAGRKLWQTPGVRDLWVEGGEIHPGEVIELCSSPQASEGADGGRMTMGEIHGGKSEIHREIHGKKHEVLGMAMGIF